MNYTKSILCSLFFMVYVPVYAGQQPASVIPTGIHIIFKQLGASGCTGYRKVYVCESGIEHVMQDVEHAKVAFWVYDSDHTKRYDDTAAQQLYDQLDTEFKSSSSPALSTTIGNTHYLFKHIGQ